MVRIRLKRMGKKGRPFYRIVVIERSRRRDGREIARLGTYDPLTDPITVKVDREQFDLWVKRGAQASDSVRMIVLGEKLKVKREPRKKPAPAEKSTPVQPTPEVRLEEPKAEKKEEAA